MYKYLLFFLIPIYTLPTTAQVVEQDSTKTQGKVVTYEEYKRQQAQKDSLETETILSVEIPVQEIAVDTTISGTPLKI